MAHAIQKLGGALSAERTAKLEDAKAAQGAHRAQFGGPFDESPAIPDELLRVLARTFDGRHGRRSLWNARGFVTAIASTPSLVSPGEWLSTLADLEASTLEESREQIGPMIQLYGLTQEALEDASTGLCPEPDEVEAIEAFCAGYVDAASRDPRWTDAPQAMEAMGPLLVLAGEADFTDDEGNPVSDDDTLEYARESLPESLLLVHAALEPERERAAHEATAASTPHRRGPKIGRNDPCTCGSGKKYKRCCGRPGQH
jgi:yecA family protein